MVFSTGYKGISASVPGPAPPCRLHWPWCLQGCFSHIFLFLPLTAAVQHFSPFLWNIITEAPPALLMGSALASGRSIGASWNWLYTTPGQLLVYPQRGQPSCCQNLAL